AVSTQLSRGLGRTCLTYGVMRALAVRPSRRDVIASFLSVAAANAACRRPATQALPGALVDPSFQAGHLLRGAPLPVGATPRPVRGPIVGAGAGGLSAAWRLAGAGLEDFVVCELEPEPGGTARSGRNAVTAYPWGAHYLPAPLTTTGPVPRLLREMGVM